MTRAVRLPWIAAAAVVVVFLGHDTMRLWAPFGPSHDGFNAALYMTGGRAIVEEGPLASRLGAVSSTQAGDRVVYAHHPPSIYVAESLAYLLPGPVEWAARLPAVLAAIAALGFVVTLLQRAGIGPGAAAVGVLCGFGTRMFFVFGAVPEPHLLGLAAMTGLSVLWQRSREDAPAPRWALGAVAALGALTDWQATLFAGLVGIAMLIEQRRSHSMAVLFGVGIGAGLTALWILWAYQGDVRDFWNRALLRASVGAADRWSVLAMVRQQMGFLHQGFPVGRWLVVPVAAVGWFDRRLRPFILVSLATVLGYAVLFKNAAAEHSYWLIDLVFPVALGVAALSEVVIRWASRSERLRLAPAALGCTVTALLAISLWRPSEDQEQNEYAAQVGAEARAITWPEGQRYAYHMFGDRGPTDLLPWVRFYARREPVGVAGPDSVPTGELVLRMVDARLRADTGRLRSGGGPLPP